MMASTWDPKPSDPCVFRGAVEDDEDPQQAQQPRGMGGSARRGGRGRILRTCVSAEAETGDRRAGRSSGEATCLPRGAQAPFLSSCLLIAGL